MSGLRSRLQAILQSLAARLVFTFILLGLCFLAIRSAVGVGASRLLSGQARKSISLQQADRAVGFSSSNPDAHSARALVLYNMGKRDQSLEEFERAAGLRPRDYLLWLELGRARDSAGDRKGALAALEEAIRLAPYYSEPRWQYGNLLLRAGRPEDGIKEMRRATETDPSLLPVLIDLVWSVTSGDAQTVEHVLEPRTDAERIQLARFFVRKGKTAEALALFRAARAIKEEDHQRFLTELLGAKRLKEAYEVWAVVRGMSGGSEKNGVAIVTDPGFESRIDLSEIGFGWQHSRGLEGIKLSLDAGQPHTGAYSLLLEWNGNSNPSTPVLSQLVLVEPNTPYRLSFATRTEGVVTGGLPVLLVADASQREARTLAQSKAFPQGTSGWGEYTVEFTTTDTMEAVLISLQRQACSTSPCPMFGRVWLDDFELKKF